MNIDLPFCRHPGIKASMPKPLPPRKFLLDCFDYDPSLGTLVWKLRPREHFKTEGMYKQHATYVAGRQAGSRKGAGVYVGLDGVDLAVHRVVWRMMTGCDPGFWEIDHIDGDWTNNRIGNLRLVTSSENKWNQKRYRTNVLPKGVAATTHNKTSFRARIFVGGKRLHLGVFASPTAAHAAYCAAAKKHFGKFWRAG